MAVTGCMGDENPFVKKVSCHLSSQNSCALSGFILPVCYAHRYGLPGERLQPRLNPHVGAHFRQELCHEIYDFVVSYLNPPLLQVKACSTVKLLPHSWSFPFPCLFSFPLLACCFSICPSAGVRKIIFEKCINCRAASVNERSEANDPTSLQDTDMEGLFTILL